MDSKKTILITRPEGQAQDLIKTVEVKGFAALMAPMLEIVPLKDVETPDLSRYQALVFTSANAVTVFAGLTDDRFHPVYVVGSHTAQSAFSLGWDCVKSQTKETGRRGIEKGKGGIEALALFLDEQRDAGHLTGDKPLLHPCGEDIAAPLVVAGLSIESLPVYKAQKVMKLSAECLAALDSGAIEAVLFYSTRTAQSFVSLLETYGRTSAAQSIKALCISDSVVESLDAILWKDVQVAHTADGAGMKRLLDRI